MKPAFRRTANEALWILFAGFMISILVSVMTGRGFFGSSGEVKNVPRVRAEPFPSLTLDQARAIFQQGGTLFIDSRNESEFKVGHIKGAVNVPLASFSRAHPTLAQISTAQPIVTYCSGTSCSSSFRLAEKLRDAGYSNVRVFFGGWKEWRAHNEWIEP